MVRIPASFFLCRLFSKLDDNSNITNKKKNRALQARVAMLLSLLLRHDKLSSEPRKIYMSCSTDCQQFKALFT